MLTGIMILWFTLTALSVLFVAIDIRSTPESPVLKWGFILLTVYTGPIGAFLYVLGCREPLAGLHEKYTSTLWRQVLGSTMHCVAGDGLGILVGAVIGAIINVSRPTEIGIEYLLGFGFGWTIFQALFMRSTAGGSFYKALKNTFIPELVSMNYLMAAMLIVTTVGMSIIPNSEDPLSMAFWFVMSMALLVGFIAAFPINWWLVSNHLKHGMMTIRPPIKQKDAANTDHNNKQSSHSEHGMAQTSEHGESSGHQNGERKVSSASIGFMVFLSFAVFIASLLFVFSY